MTVSERIRELDEIDRTFCGYKLAEHLKEMRDGLTLNDLFNHFGGRVQYERAMKILGWNMKYGFIRSNEQISRAIEDGTALIKEIRTHGQMVVWLIRK